MDRGEDYKHGFPEEVWTRAKEEARSILVSYAQRKTPLSYSELCDKMTIINFDPHDSRLAHFLGQISTREHEEGRPLLTALVVHKHDFSPGKGFFKLAQSLGFSVYDEESFWTEQIDAVGAFYGP